MPHVFAVLFSFGVHDNLQVDKEDASCVDG